MNILVIGKFTEGQFGYHIVDAANDMGNNVIEFDPTIKYKYSRSLIGRRSHQIKLLMVNNLVNTTFYREYRIKKIKKVLDQNKIDLTISTHDFLFPDEVELIKNKSKSPVVLWFPDSVSNFYKSFFLIANYDKLFFKDPYIVKVLTEQYNKTNIYYLPECCNPKYHKSLVLTDEDYKKYSCDISTYGSPHNIRSSFFVQLLDYDHKIKIWGPQTPVWLGNKRIKSLYTGEYIFNESKAKAVLATKININTLHPSEIFGINTRAFEIAGIGGFQIIHWRPGLINLFEDGNELVSFSDFDELLEKINYYLREKELRNEIAKAGQKRAYAQHKYVSRLNLMFDTVFKNSKGFEMPRINFKIT